MSHTPSLLPCDGCGQPADLTHISRRVQRLEWATRYRPIHIQSLVVSGISPATDDEFLYNPQASFGGEAGNILRSAAVSTEENRPESVLAEFQKRGLMLIHVLECPLSPEASALEVRPILEKWLAATVRRIRRSLKPKRVLLVSPVLAPVADKLLETDLGCPVFRGAEGTFFSSNAPGDAEFQAFRAALVGSHATTA